MVIELYIYCRKCINRKEKSGCGSSDSPCFDGGKFHILPNYTDYSMALYRGMIESSIRKDWTFEVIIK